MAIDNLKILYVGSDLGNPKTTMEAHMLEHLAPVFDKSHILSIDILRKNNVGLNITNVKGIKRGPKFIRKPIYGLEMLIKYTAYIRKYQIVHFLWVGFSPFLPILIKIAHLFDVKVVVTILNRNAPCNRYKSADALIFHSESTLKKYTKLVANPPIYACIPPVVSPPNDIFKWDYSEEPYFLFLSGPKSREQIKERGVLFLLEIFSQLYKTKSDISLRFVGRWPLGKEILEDLKVKCGAMNVNMTHEPVPNIYKLIRESRGVLVPYQGKRIGEVPLSALEAMACNRYAIVTDGLGLTDSNNRLLHSLPSEKEIWIEKILELSGQLIKNKSEQRLVADRKAIDKYCMSHKRLYSELLGDNRI